MNNITKELNTIYINNKDKEINIIIDELLNYFQTIKYDNNLFNKLRNNKEILLNSLEYNIFDDIEDLLNHNINNYKLYELLMINILNDIILKNKLKTFDEYLNEVMTILNVNKINNYYILRNQYYYITKNSHKLIPLNNIILYNEKEIEEIKKDYKLQKRNYKLLQTKEFDNNNIIRSYLCYFKSAINMLINHPLFLKITNIDTDSLKLLKGGYYHPYEILMYGGNELWNELSNENINLINLLKIFQNITNNYYILGLPGIKYYPHIILQYLLNILDNKFSDIFNISHIGLNLHITEKKIEKYYGIKNVKEIKNFKFIFISNYNIFLSPLQINKNNNTFDKDYIYDYYLKINIPNNFNNSAFIISTIQNDPLVFNTFNNIVNYKLSFDDILLRTKGNIKIIKDNNIFYNYYYKININDIDYYLQSFIVIEYILKINMCFHCVYIKLEYNYDINGILYIKNKIRYDDLKLNYNDKKNLNDIPFLNEELGLFKEDKINDLYFTKYNEKN